MATYTLFNKVLSSLERKNVVGGIFCDLQKAFTCVNQNILLPKMEFYGISGIVNKLMRSYLENRHHRVSVKDIKLNKVSSKWEHVKHGVPQGPVHSFIMHSVNPYKVNQPIGYRTCHNTSVF